MSIAVWALAVFIAVMYAYYANEPQFYGIAALAGGNGLAGLIRYYLTGKK